MQERPVNRQRYTIRVGLRQVEVQGVNRAEAIDRARAKLCQEMPRMWDVIQALNVQHFEVDETPQQRHLF